MLSPLSRGYGTWTGKYDPYNDDGAESDSLPEIDEPHRHGITVGFVSRSPSATTISPQYRTTREATLSGSAHHTREATMSSKRPGSRRDLSSAGHVTFDNTDPQMNLPKTYLTKKGALVLFSAPEDEVNQTTSRTDVPHPRYNMSRKSDLIDTSLRLGTLDKLVMSVMKFGEDEIEGDKNSITEEKNKLFMKFLNKVDEKDMDERAQPGGDVDLYLRDLKHTTSLQMGLSGDTALPRSREALELRAILRGLQNNQWPCSYKLQGPNFKQPSRLAYQFSRPPSHLHQPPRNQYQRILSSKKLEDSVQSLKSYLGRSFDDDAPVPLLTRRRHKRDGEKKYSTERIDDEERKQWLQRPHTNTPTQLEGKMVTNISDSSEQVEDEQNVDGKSTSRISHDEGYQSVTQGDSCSFSLGPRDWTPFQSQTPAEEMFHPKTPTVDLKKMVDKGSTELEDGCSIDDGLDGEGIVVGLAQGSDDSDVDIIYSTSSHFEVPDNTLDTVEGFHSNDVSVQNHSIKSVSPESLLYNHENHQEVDSAIGSQTNESKFSGKISNETVNISDGRQIISIDKGNNLNSNLVATSCDNIYNDSEPAFIASDGESVDENFDNEIKVEYDQTGQMSAIQTSEMSRQQTPGSASSQKQSRSRTPSSIHSITAQDDDQSSVTILPHDQDLISVDVRASITQPESVLDQITALENESLITDSVVAPTTETQVKDTESVFTGDDATSMAMSMGEDTTSVIQQLRGLQSDDEESKDKLGEITDTRLPRHDRGRIEMIEIPHPPTPRSTDLATYTEDKPTPQPKSESSSSKTGESVEEDVVPDTMVSLAESEKKKTEFPVIPDYLKPKPQPKSQLRKDQKKKAQVQKGKKPSATKTEKQTTDDKKEEKEDEITQVIKKKVTLPPENEHSVIPDFVGEALKRSKERSKQQLDEEFEDKQKLIGQEMMISQYEGLEGMTAEELELEKKALKEKADMVKEKLKDKQFKKPEEKTRKSGGSSSIKSKKSKGVPKDSLQQEKERLRQLKEQDKQQRLSEIKAIEDKIAAQSQAMTSEEKKFKDKLQEVQMELERIEREAEMAEQTEADVRSALRDDRMRRNEDKAKQKKEELARRRQMLYDKKVQERQLKEEARQRELQKIMMLMDDEERKRRQEEAKQKQEEEEKEEEKKRREEEEEIVRLERNEEERRRQLEEEIEQDQLRKIQEEQDEIRRQQELIAAEKEALLEEQRKKRELIALEELRQREELDKIQMEEMKRIAEEKARIQELQQLEEEVRDKMKQEMEMRKDAAINRREYNLDSKSNLNKMRHSQGITRAWVWSYFLDWPIETYMRPIGEAEKKQKEAKLREKRKKAR